MSWELFYLICFAVGFTFSILSFLSGTFHVHVPKFMHFSGGHGIGHGPMGGSHGPTAGAHGHVSTGATHAHSGPPKGMVKTSTQGAHFSFFNPLTTAAFLTWFGGAGYLLEHFRHIWVYAGLGFASLSGLVAAGFVFWFVSKVLMAHERSLDPLDYEMVGVLGYVSSSIRGGGTGEIIFTQQEARRTCAARCETGESLPRGMEVMVIRYDRGIAYVRPWDELTGSNETDTRHE